MLAVGEAQLLLAFGRDKVTGSANPAKQVRVRSVIELKLNPIREDSNCHTSVVSSRKK